MDEDKQMESGANNPMQLAAAIIPLSGRIMAGIALKKGNAYSLLSFASVDSCTLNDGVPTDFPKFVAAIKSALAKASKEAKAEMFSVSIGINGADVKGLNSRAAVYIGGKKTSVKRTDIEKAIIASSQIELPTNRAILDTVPSFFAVDDTRDLENPEGLEGLRLECESHIITCRAEAIDSMVKGLTKAGFKLESLFYDGWAGAKASIGGGLEDRKVLYLDVCEGHTDCILIDRCKPRHISLFGYGHQFLASSFSRECNISLGAAERLLAEHSSVCGGEEFLLERGVEIVIPAESGFEEATTTKGHLWDFVAKFYRNLFAMVKKSLEIRELTEGTDSVVLGGYALRVQGIVDLCREYFDASAKINEIPEQISEIDPLITRLTGVLKLAFERRRTSVVSRENNGRKLFSRIFGWINDRI